MFSFRIITENFEVLSRKVLWMVGKGECDSVGFFVR